MPKVSVIIPVYKVESYLNRCVSSVLNQTLQDIEIILVDDGSPDNCPKMCDEFALKDSRVKVVHKKNEGLGYARNSGLEIATGDYIGFVDSDDFVDKEMYERLYSEAVKQNAEAAYCGYQYVRKGQKTIKTNFTDEILVWDGREEVKQFLMDLVASDISRPEDSRFGATATKGIFLRSIIEKKHILFYSEREYVSEDGLFSIDFFTNCQKVLMIPGEFYFYIYNPKSLTASYRVNRFQQNKSLYSLGKQKLMDAYNDEALLLQYDRMLLAAARVCVMQEVLNARKMGFIKSLSNIKEICNDPMIQDVLAIYPWQKLPLKRRIFAYLMKHKLNFLQYLTISLTIRKN